MKAPTTLFHGRYIVHRTLGQGNQAIVSLAEDRDTGTLVAVKQFQVSGRSLNERLLGLQEGALQTMLKHPAIPRCYDYGFDEERGSVYLILEYIDGITLEDCLQALPTGQGLPVFPLPDICELGRQLCAVLEYLHTQTPPIIFRDLKPSNVMLTASGSVFLIDFGIAKRTTPLMLPSTGTGYGTPGWAAPELYPDKRGRISYSTRSDLYSLGVLLHQLLTGLNPAEKASAKACEQQFAFAPLDLDGIPFALTQLVQDLLQIEPTLRPRSAGLVQEVLALLQCHSPHDDPLLSGSSSHEQGGEGSLCSQM